MTPLKLQERCDFGLKNIYIYYRRYRKSDPKLFSAFFLSFFFSPNQAGWLLNRCSSSPIHSHTRHFVFSCLIRCSLAYFLFFLTQHLYCVYCKLICTYAWKGNKEVEICCDGDTCLYAENWIKIFKETPWRYRKFNKLNVNRMFVSIPVNFVFVLFCVVLCLFCFVLFFQHKNVNSFLRCVFPAKELRAAATSWRILTIG